MLTHLCKHMKVSLNTRIRIEATMCIRFWIFLAFVRSESYANCRLVPSSGIIGTFRMFFSWVLVFFCGAVASSWTLF